MISVSVVPPSDSLLGNYSSPTLDESGRLGGQLSGIQRGEARCIPQLT